jgi:hypothetical protein
LLGYFGVSIGTELFREVIAVVAASRKACICKCLKPILKLVGPGCRSAK